jgi:hypothetical protein
MRIQQQICFDGEVKMVVKPVKASVGDVIKYTIAKRGRDGKDTDGPVVLSGSHDVTQDDLDGSSRRDKSVKQKKEGGKKGRKGARFVVLIDAEKLDEDTDYVLEAYGVNPGSNARSDPVARNFKKVAKGQKLVVHVKGPASVGSLQPSKVYADMEVYVKCKVKTCDGKKGKGNKNKGMGGRNGDKGEKKDKNKDKKKRKEKFTKNVRVSTTLKEITIIIKKILSLPKGDSVV